MTVYCQNCGKDTAGKQVTFYGNVLCSDECRKQLSERVYFRDTPPEAGTHWYCPHCGAQNALGDPRKNLRPNCTSCAKPLDPGSAAPPKKAGCLSVLLLVLLPLGLLSGHAACATRQPPPAPGNPTASAREPAVARPQAAVPATPPKPATPPAPAPQPAPATQPAAAAPSDEPPQYEYGAKFEPPMGRLIHGMGQWLDGNLEYLRGLGDEAILPAASLVYRPLGDWAKRSWEAQLQPLARNLVAEREAGRFPKLELSLFGLGVRSNKEETVDNEIAAGDPRYDERIRDMAAMVRDLGGPVFVGIGEEFSGEWHPYTPYVYPRAFRRIVEIFRAEGADNAAFLWTYEPSAPDDFDLCDEKGCRWYPGDDVVDWFGLDVFEVEELSGQLGRGGALSKYGRSLRFLEMAKKHGKPVIIGECSAARVDITRDPQDGMADWETWFVPFLRLLDEHPQIKGFFYENVDWTTIGDSAALGWEEARINLNPYILQKWKEELRNPRYIHAGQLALLNGYAAACAVGAATRLTPALPEPAPARARGKPPDR